MAVGRDCDPISNQLYSCSLRVVFPLRRLAIEQLSLVFGVECICLSNNYSRICAITHSITLVLQRFVFCLYLERRPSFCRFNIKALFDEITLNNSCMTCVAVFLQRRIGLSDTESLVLEQKPCLPTGGEVSASKSLHACIAFL